MENDNENTAYRLPEEAELSRFTRVPPETLGKYLAWPEAILRQEVNSVTTILKRFAKAVLDSASAPDNAGRFLRELDLRTISLDHDWRQIFAAIRNQTKSDTSYNQAVLVKYLQFLSFRKRLFEFVHARKAGLEDTTGFAQTVLFSSPEAVMNKNSSADNPWIRLPMGEAVRLELPEQGTIEVRLAEYHLSLQGGDPPLVIDERGIRYRIEHGRIIVGRHPESDIVIHTGSGMVSRAHVLLERGESNRELTLMDLSSGGTYAQASHLRGSSLPQIG